MAKCRNFAIAFQIAARNDRNNVIAKTCAERLCFFGRETSLVLKQVYAAPICVFDIIRDNCLRDGDAMIRAPIRITQAVVADKLFAKRPSPRLRNRLIGLPRPFQPVCRLTASNNIGCIITP